MRKTNIVTRSSSVTIGLKHKEITTYKYTVGRLVKNSKHIDNKYLLQTTDLKRQIQVLIQSLSFKGYFALS
jgi:hypothetical protein